MASRIQEYLDNIKNAIYGRQVRQSIHDAIEECYSDVSSAKTLADNSNRTLTSNLTILNDAISRALSAAISAENVTQPALDATDDASDAAEEAHNAALSVIATISDLEQAALRANTAAEQIDGLTVTYEDAPPTTPASASIETADGHKNIHFILKQGDPGTSFVIKGHAFATLSLLENGVPNPEVGDQYNVGSAPPYDVYRWTGDFWENQGKFSSSFLTYQDKMIYAYDWESDDQVPDYPKKATIYCSGVTSAMFVSIIFNDDDASSGNFYNLVETAEDAIYVWGKYIPASPIRVPLIVAFK